MEMEMEMKRKSSHPVGVYREKNESKMKQDEENVWIYWLLVNVRNTR